MQQAATSHTRLLALLKRCSLNYYIPPMSTRIIESSNSAVARFDSCRIVPGGRFLVTSAKNCIRLWDLGNSAHSILGSSISAIATLIVGDQLTKAPVRCEWIVLDSTPDSQGIRIILEVASEEMSLCVHPCNSSILTFKTNI